MTDVSIPIVLGPTGRVPTPPATILANYTALVAAESPDYTSNLPGSLIEDMASTAVGALTVMDQNLTDLIDSVTPYGANEYLLGQQGAIYGVQQGADTNTSVYVVFTGTVGFIVPAGFTVGDGTHQYVVQDGGVVAAGGSTAPLYCLANVAGSWPVPANTVTATVTSVPITVTLTWTNPLAGTPSPGAQSVADYRAQVLQSGLVTATGAPSMLKALLANVPGVQQRLIAAQQQSPGWKIIVGGGDPYQIAYAIYSALFDISNLVGSVINVLGITNASPGVVTTDLNHGLITGQTGVHITGVMGMTLTGGPYTVTVITEKTFSFGVNTTSSGAWTSGGVITPNPRNVTASITDYPDVYTVPFVVPPQQTVQLSVTWNTISPYLVSSTAVAQLVQGPLANYINSIPVGAPINEFELDNTFQAAVLPLISTADLTRMVWTVTINGIATSPASGTKAVYGDPESYFYCLSTDVTVTQG